MNLSLRDHTFLGLTQSLCPECLEVVPAKVIERRRRVYFRKTCPRHGVREDFVCSDSTRFDRNEYATPGKRPIQYGVQPKRGCPYDCGLCEEHEQHTCIALLEITDNCNLTCPMCFAASRPGLSHVPTPACLGAIDALVAREGRAEVLQLSGGEPTLHPDFIDVLDHACGSEIDVVMINTNGVTLANDDILLDQIARRRKRVEVYLQFDSVQPDGHRLLRGASLLETKRRAIDRLGQAGIRTTLVSTVQTGVNEDQIGDIVRLGLEHRHITGISFQPAVYTGRYFLPDQLDHRVTFPDIIDAIADQMPDVFRANDFLPLPCAHPNGHVLAYAYRDRAADGNHRFTPMNRFIDIAGNMDLLANGIVFTRDRARSLVERYVSRCGSVRNLTDLASSPSPTRNRVPATRNDAPVPPGDDAASHFFDAAIGGTLSQSDLMRITITSFMDAYNFDLRQLMKSCVHHLLPTGHLIPFSAYNVLYRDGHVPLPSLRGHPGRAPNSDANHAVSLKVLP